MKNAAKLLKYKNDMQHKETQYYLQDIARACGVHRVTLWRWLKGRRAELHRLGYRRGHPLPCCALAYLCENLVIYPEELDQ